eukprot:COSAG02_NODE_153_length_33128_cov_10.471253_9_plen_58_part_00
MPTLREPSGRSAPALAQAGRGRMRAGHTGFLLTPARGAGRESQPITANSLVQRAGVY